MTKVASLKYLGQTSRSIQVLAISTIFLRYMPSAMMVLRCLQETWLKPEVEKDKYLAIASLTS